MFGSISAHLVLLRLWGGRVVARPHYPSGPDTADSAALVSTPVFSKSSRVSAVSTLLHVCRLLFLSCRLRLRF